MFLPGLSVLTCTHERMTNRPCALLFVTLVKEKIKAFHFSRLRTALQRISANNRWTINRGRIFSTTASSCSLILSIKSNIWKRSDIVHVTSLSFNEEGGGVFRLFHPNIHLLAWIWAIETGTRGTVWSCCISSDTSDRSSGWLRLSDVLAASVTPWLIDSFGERAGAAAPAPLPLERLHAVRDAAPSDLLRAGRCGSNASGSDLGEWDGSGDEGVPTDNLWEGRERGN